MIVKTVETVYKLVNCQGSIKKCNVFHKLLPSAIILGIVKWPAVIGVIKKLKEYS